MYLWSIGKHELHSALQLDGQECYYLSKYDQLLGPISRYV